MKHTINLLTKQVLQLIFSPNPVGTRYTVAFASLLWGIILLLPSEAYSVTLFRGMEDLLPEDVWGGLFLTHGVISLYCTIISRKDIFAFIFDTIYGMLLWTTVTVALIVSSKVAYAPPHLSAQIILCLCTLWLFIRFNLQKGVACK